MRAIRVHELGAPDVMRLEEVPDPVPGPGQVVVRVRAAGVHPVETYIRSGSYAALPQLPYTPGGDAAREVEAVGPSGAAADAPAFQPGDRVFTSRSLSGSYAEKVLCDASTLHRLPPSLGFEQGAALGIPYGTAWRALVQRARAQPAESVLVHGASGGVGVAAVQLARALGLFVVGTAGSDEGRKLVLAQGAHHVVDHADFEGALRLSPEGKGFDVILEMLANVNLGRDLPLLARGGRVVVVGSRGSVEIDPRALMSRDAAVLGMVLFNASPAETRTLWAGVEALLERAALVPVVGRRLPLAEAPRAHREVLSGKALGKIVLTTA